MTIYIAGKMNGLPDKGRAAFFDAERRLKGQGFAVLNPAVLPDGMAGCQYLPICLAMLEQAEAIYLLEGWEDSPGAPGMAVCLIPGQDGLLRGTGKCCCGL